MPEKRPTGLPLETGNDEERELWSTLGRHAPEEPSPALREGFYRRLEREGRTDFSSRLSDLLGFRGHAGWLSAAACLLLGLGTGLLVSGAGDEAESRLAALEQNVTLLNRRLILDRLENEAPAKRLRGIMDAAWLAGGDAEIATALLERATRDRVPSVRSAAIDALGARIATPSVGKPLMQLLERADSPIVQLALVDLVLAHGDDAQRDELLTLARERRLHPDLASYVLDALQTEAA